ncbi:hypothetical protein [Thiococcus pfennigii]|uniref:hypothetical protein n=1 Tax=Thiococcus pfennigii TaxID=1057 RepID=UPI001903305F|nr:hypothetical protein [Thiococcus pfennigii]MBK1731461.1 hypothetical protein [Thiococcus pfennigii]
MPREQRRPGLDVQAIDFVAEDVAAFARVHGAEPVRVLGLPEVVARPDAVYWDRDHSTLVYTRAAEDGRVIFVPVAPGRAAKKRGRFNALVNAYKITPERLANRGRFRPFDRGAP